MLLIAFLLAQVSAATLQVCASGCAHALPSAAMTAANHGDIIEVKAGETFIDLIGVSWKSDSSKYITIRSSRWAELPPPGYRVGPEHDHLMPTLTPQYGSEPIIKIGQYQSSVSSVNTGANTITLPPGTGGLVNGDPIACRINNDPAAGAVIMGGVVASRVYIISGVVAETFQLTYNGAVVDITSAGTGTQLCTPVKIGHHVAFQGIKFQTDAVTATSFNLLQFGTAEEAAVEGMPHHLVLDRCRVLGRVGQDGPRNGLYANANYVQVLDSDFRDIKQLGNENHAIFAGVNSQHMLVRNTGLNGASMSFFTGGTGSAIANVQPTGIKLIGNYLYKSGYMSYAQGAGAPSGACFPGRYYRNTTPSPNSCENSACYTCSAGGAWVLDTAAYYRSQWYVDKAIIELKECTNCEITGNFIENGFDNAFDSGNPGAGIALPQVDSTSPWTGIFDVAIRYNRLNNVWRGIGVLTTGGFATKNRNVTVSNNLMENMTNFPEMSSNATALAQSYPYGIQAGMFGIRYESNTARLGATGIATAWLLMSGSDGPHSGFGFAGNIGQQGTYSLFASGDGTCGAGGLALHMPVGSAPYPVAGNLQNGSGAPTYGGCITNTVNVNPVSFVSSTNSRLTPGSPYSADCVTGCAFTGPAGKDVGADIDEVECHTSGAVAGTPRCLSDLRIQAGSTKALLAYTSPIAGTCDVTLYTNIARTTEHGDTNTAGEKLDSRAGNYNSGTQRIFVLGTNTVLTASTKYYGKVACGSQLRPFELTTRATSLDRSVPITYSTARTGEYSSSPDFSSPTSLSSATKHVVPITAGAIRWYRETGGIARGLIAP